MSHRLGTALTWLWGLWTPRILQIPLKESKGEELNICRQERTGYVLGKIHICIEIQGFQHCPLFHNLAHISGNNVYSRL